MNKIPKKFNKYFWDVKPKDLKIGQHSLYIIERLLEHGDIKSRLIWIFPNFTFSSRSHILRMLTTIPIPIT